VPLSLTIYTSDYDEEPPAPVKNVKAERDGDGRWHVTWSRNTEPDFCYYRVYRGDEQIGSTIGQEFVDPTTGAGGQYKIVAVDQSGNSG